MSEDSDLIEVLRTPVELQYTYSAGQSASRFLRAIAEGRLVGQRCPVDGRVYFPSRGSCSQHGAPLDPEPVELVDRGTIITYSVNRVPAENIKLDLLLLDDLFPSPFQFPNSTKVLIFVTSFLTFGKSKIRNSETQKR